MGEYKIKYSSIYKFDSYINSVTLSKNGDMIMILGGSNLYLAFLFQNTQNEMFSVKPSIYHY
jgi:hypothetical protein